MERMLLLPSLGPFHILHPRYNAATVLALLEAHRPKRIYLASLGPEELEKGLWQEEDPLLFHLLPWAEGRGVEVVALDALAPLKAEAQAFREALGLYPGGQAYLEALKGHEETLAHLLQTPLTPEALPSLAQNLREAYGAFVQAFGEGPATGHRRRRMEAVAGKLKGLEGAVVAEALDYALLAELLPVPPLPPHTPTPEEEARALLDRAWRLEEEDDWARLLEGLFRIGTPEALFLAGQIYLAAGQPEEALALLEEVVQGDFHHPGYLPGYALARLGQVLDLLGQRERALRAYRGVLALAWAPEEARQTAQAGLRHPFQPQRTG